MVTRENQAIVAMVPFEWYRSTRERLAKSRQCVLGRVDGRHVAARGVRGARPAGDDDIREGAVTKQVNGDRPEDTAQLARQLGVQAQEWRGLQTQYIEGVIDGRGFRWYQYSASDGWRWQLTVRGETDRVIASGPSTPTTRSSSLLQAIREVRVWAAALECPRDHAAQSTEGARYCSRCGALTSDPLEWKLSAGTGTAELA